MPKKTEPKDTQSTQPEQVQQVRISDIHPFKNHPFKVVDDALMQETVDSIMQYESGARTPKHDLLCALAQTLEVPVSALEVPYIKSRDELKQLLQALEDEYGLTVTITETHD